jgi:hypothetical protein
LRGPEAAKVGRGFFVVAGAIVLVIFAAALVVNFISAVNDNDRIERLKTHGIPVMVRVVGCYGELGGSGSNAAAFACKGAYIIGGTTFIETIGAKSSFSDSGERVRGVVDPSDHRTVMLESALRATTASRTKYFVPGLLTLLLIALSGALLRFARRSRRNFASEGDELPSSGP